LTNQNTCSKINTQPGTFVVNPCRFYFCTLKIETTAEIHLWFGQPASPFLGNIISKKGSHPRQGIVPFVPQKQFHVHPEMGIDNEEHQEQNRKSELFLFFFS